MTNTDTFIALRDRVREATGADRELDARIWMALHPKIQVMVDSGRPDGRGGFTPAQYDDAENVFCDGWNEWGDACLWLGAASITASIDAALALVERVLGTYAIDLSIDPSGQGCTIWVWPGGLSGDRQERYDASSSFICFAILDALLTALIEQEPKS